jgi:hypothetical protein
MGRPQVSNISDFVEQTLQSPLPSPEVLLKSSLICLELWLELWWNCGTGQEFQLGLKEAFSELNEYLGIYAQLNHQVLCFFSIIFPKLYFLYFF